MVEGRSRSSAKLTALADELTAHGSALDMLAGPLTGIVEADTDSAALQAAAQGRS